MPFRDWPIKQKLTAILLLVSGLVLTLTSGAFAIYQVLTLRETTLQHLSTLGRIVAANSTAALAFANEFDAAEVLAALRAEPQVAGARLFDGEGRPFATYLASLPDDALPATPEGDGYRFTGGYLVGYEPVAEGEGVRLGTLYLVSDMRVMYDTFRNSVVIGLVVLVISLIAAYGLAAVLQGRVSRPIVALAATAKAVSDHQDYSVRAPEEGNDELGRLTTAFNHMLSRIQEQDRALRESNEQLEQRVIERTRELEAANEELERHAVELTASNTELDAFAYSVSHDLRAPLRSIDGFSQVLLEDYGEKLDESGRDSLNRVRAASQRMGALIDDLLKLARVTRAEMRTETVDLSAMARDIVSDLENVSAGREVTFAIADGLEARGDARLLRIALENLLRNSWKYTANQPRPVVEFSAVDGNGERVFMLRDNGAGFDMKYADKLFGVFQRLHSVAEFEGTGVGLATVRRIVTRHGGRIWAEAAVNRGATFYFTLEAV